jgi:hypothetical protein
MNGSIANSQSQRRVSRTNSSRPCGCGESGRFALAMQGFDLLCSAMRPARTALAVCWWVARSTASARHLQGNTGRIVPAHPAGCALRAEVRRLMNLPRLPIHQGPSHRLFQMFSYLCSLFKCGNDVAFPPAKPHSSAAPEQRGLPFRSRRARDGQKFARCDTGSGLKSRFPPGRASDPSYHARRLTSV